MKLKSILFILFLSIVYSYIFAGDPWADYYGTSSTAGTWDSGIRVDPNTSIYPPYVVRWERYAWGGTNIPVIASLNTAQIYDGYIFLGQGKSLQPNDAGYIWAWDIATGVTKTGYPLGPLDGGVASYGLTINNNKLYAASMHEVYGWDLTTNNMLAGFPINVTETVGNVVNLYGGIIFSDDRLYFCTSENGYVAKYYLYVKNALDGSEVWRKELDDGGALIPYIWQNRVYVATVYSKKIYCWDKNTGADMPNFPVDISGGGMADVRARPIIFDGILYIGTTGVGNGRFFAIDAITGAIIWQYLSPSEIASTASIRNDKVYFGNHLGQLSALYKDTGTPVPGFPVVGAGGDGPISIANGVIYSIGNRGYNITAVDAANGNILWQTQPNLSYLGGELWQYNYQSITIGQNEIIAVCPRANGIVVFEMPTPTATPSITPTETVSPTYTTTETFINTFTKTPTNSITVTSTETPSATPTPSLSQTQVITVTQTFTIPPTASQTLTLTITSTQTPEPANFCFELLSNYPNPFSAGTNIVFNLCKASEITIRIYSVSGELVKQITQAGVPGNNSIYWNTKNRRSDEIASGIFIYVVEARSGNEKAVKYGKLAVIK